MEQLIYSSVTSTVILFFNCHVKIGDTISTVVKYLEIKGKISDIGFFFVPIKTKNNVKVDIHSNLFIQKKAKYWSLNYNQFF